MALTVKEPQCACCEHREVCSLKDDFLKIIDQSKSAEGSGIFKNTMDLDWITVDVKCKYYRGSLQTYRDITVPYTTYTYCPYSNTNCIYHSIYGCNKPITDICPYDQAITTVTCRNATKGE